MCNALISTLKNACSEYFTLLDTINFTAFWLDVDDEGDEDVSAISRRNINGMWSFFIIIWGIWTVALIDDIGLFCRIMSSPWLSTLKIFVELSKGHIYRVFDDHKILEIKP